MHFGFFLFNSSSFFFFRIRCSYISFYSVDIPSNQYVADWDWQNCNLFVRNFCYLKPITATCFCFVLKVGYSKLYKEFPHQRSLGIFTFVKKNSLVINWWFCCDYYYIIFSHSFAFMIIIISLMTILLWWLLIPKNDISNNKYHILSLCIMYTYMRLMCICTYRHKIHKHKMQKFSWLKNIKRDFMKEKKKRTESKQQQQRKTPQNIKILFKQRNITNNFN